MIRKQVRIGSITTGSRTHESRRLTYGKIKVTPLSGRQAIGMACLSAGASVGARAARGQKRNDSNIDFGTRALPLFVRAEG